MDEDLKKLLEQNLKKNDEIYELMKKLKTYFVFSQIFGVLRLFLIIVPIVLAIIYLPPFFHDFYSQLQKANPAMNLDSLWKMYEIR